MNTRTTAQASAAERIKAEMKKKNLTAYALAKACNMPPSTISRILSGQAHPRPSTLALIAAALETRIVNLIGEKKAKALMSQNPVLKAVPNKRIPLITAETAYWIDDSRDDEAGKQSGANVVWLPGLPDPEVSSLVDFCIVAPDDALSPKIRKGDYLYFRKTSSKDHVRSEDVVAALGRNSDGSYSLSIRKIFFLQGDEELLLPSEQMKPYYKEIILSPSKNSNQGIKVVGALVARISIQR